MNVRHYPFIFVLVTIFLAAAFGEIHAAQNHIFPVTDFGATGDGQTLDTKAIQAAVDACSANGGGTVFFPAGTYLSGTIYLKDHVRLDLGVGATLLGSTNEKDFPQNTCDFPSYSDRYVSRALLWAEGKEDISITGHGTIDGQGPHYIDNIPEEAEWKELTRFFKDSTRYVPEARYINRPYIIRFISCRDIHIENITLRNSPMWMQQYLDCDFVTIKNITVYNHGSKNNDMIDIDCCRNVVISGCYGDSDDDGITLKSTGARPTENVAITNCLVSSFCNAIKMGTESSGGFKNISITNCVIRPSAEPRLIYGRREGLAGIALEIVDGGALDGVTISDITITGTTAPIFMRLGDRGRTVRPGLDRPAAGTFRNVVVSNITANSASVTGCSITGIPGHYVENVTLSNIRINYLGGGTLEQAQTDPPEVEDKYPESTMFGVLPAYGFFVRHVRGLTMRDIDLSYQAADYRPALVFDDVEDLRLGGVNVKTEKETAAQIVLDNVRDALISECLVKGEAPFLRLQSGSSGISVIGNDLSRIKTPIVFDEATPASAAFVRFNRGE